MSLSAVLIQNSRGRKEKKKRPNRTEPDKLPYPLLLPQRTELTKNNIIPPHTKMQVFLQITQMSEIEQYDLQWHPPFVDHQT